MFYLIISFRFSYHLVTILLICSILYFFLLLFLVYYIVWVWTLLFLLLYFIFIKFFSYVHQLLHLLYSYSYFTHMFYVHLYVSTLLVRMYIALFLLPYGAKGANMPYELLRYNNCAIIITTITVTFSIGFQ